MRDVILTYPNFSKKLIAHTDDSDYQLGDAIAQEGKPIVTFSRQINKAQRNYTTAEKYLMIIV